MQEIFLSLVDLERSRVWVLLLANFNSLALDSLGLDLLVLNPWV